MNWRTPLVCRALPAIWLTLFTCFTEADTQPDNPNDGFNAALTLSKGYYDANWITLDLEPVTEMESFASFDIELRYQYKGFFIEFPGESQNNVEGQFSGNAIGYNFYNTPHWSFDAYLVNASESARFQFGSERGLLYLERENDNRFGLRATGYHDNLMTQFIITPVSLKSEIGGVEASISARYDWQIRNLVLYASAGIRYRSKDIIDHFYGISEEEAAAIISVAPDTQAWRDYVQPYEGRQDLTLSAKLGFEYPLSESWVLGGYYSAYENSNSITDSPLIVRDKVKNSFALTLSYVF